MFVLGLGGGTNSGKTTLCKRIFADLPYCTIINQDDYFKTLEELVAATPPGQEIDRESCDALHMDRLVAAVKQQCIASTDRVLIIEGHLVLSYPPLVALLDATVFIEVSYELALKRRLTRGYDPPDEPGAFENIVWPGYEKIVEGVRKEVKETLFLNADSPEDNYSQIEALIQRSL